MLNLDLHSNPIRLLASSEIFLGKCFNHTEFTHLPMQRLNEITEVFG